MSPALTTPECPPAKRVSGGSVTVPPVARPAGARMCHWGGIPRLEGPAGLPLTLFSDVESG